jgi:uncharacterized protein YprB with RNaseH-like and TPR domain
MIEKTFCHVKGITADFERLLWEKGIAHWDDFLAKESGLDTFPRKKLDKLKVELPLSKQAFQQKNLRYFQNMLNPKEHWRLVELGKVGFIDIETTGLSKIGDEITVIGIYDGTRSHLYVNGKNLFDAKAKLQEFDIIVSFNGKQFDIPFIEHHFSCTYTFAHLDLRYMLKEFGFQGGLKSIERQLGIGRDFSVEGIDGFEAVNLWYRYKRGNIEALQKLLKYNEQDIVNLHALLKHYLKIKKERLLGI